MIQARYSHVTEIMQRRLLAGLTDIWLDARWALAARSPVATLDRLLVARAREIGT